MNKYLKHLKRLEFIVTLDCTGKCKHCSVGECLYTGKYLDKEIASNVVYELADKFDLESIMTFGGEPLLHPDCVCAIHTAATEMKIPKRQLITNGFFSKKIDKIKSVCENIARSGVNDLLLSVDAFHQDAIPLDIVKIFAKEMVDSGVNIRTNPAWLVSKEHDNSYNNFTHKILKEFEQLGIEEGLGNIVFPEGNAVKYLGEYFEGVGEYTNPYAEDPKDLKSISIEADGTLFGRSLYTDNIIDILKDYES